MQTYSIPDMSCAHCRAVLEKTVQAADPQAKVSVDLEQRQVTLTSDKTDDVLAALAEEGYPATAL